MSREGDPSKQPPECKSVFIPWSDENPKPKFGIGDGVWTKCPNIQSVSEDWESETYACDVCGKRYTLYDDEMR